MPLVTTCCVFFFSFLGNVWYSNSAGSDFTGFYSPPLETYHSNKTYYFGELIITIPLFSYVVADPRRCGTDVRPPPPPPPPPLNFERPCFCHMMQNASNKAQIQSFLEFPRPPAVRDFTLILLCLLAVRLTNQKLNSKTYLYNCLHFSGHIPRACGCIWRFQRKLKSRICCFVTTLQPWLRTSEYKQCRIEEGGLG